MDEAEKLWQEGYVLTQGKEGNPREGFRLMFEAAKIYDMRGDLGECDRYLKKLNRIVCASSLPRGDLEREIDRKSQEIGSRVIEQIRRKFPR